MGNNIICSCNNVTVRDIQSGIGRGISNYKEFQKKSHIGTCCFSCNEKNRALFDKMLRQYRLSFFDKIIVL